ncbi:outer membrane beta-barrel protein [uncultured Alistipes sp.]|uniref:outer membrane beta-barrel protein n=1 Tax=uncultured Alistipes sp. TaxID=538949 RepID=UPI00262525F2|nr:outer membrane beta-barrel protein [uncultured Alistipes sp.]
MKKIILAVMAALFISTAASAQQAGNWAVGPRMNIYTNTGDAVVGLGAFARYSFDDNWRIEPSLTALLHSGCSIDLSCDAQYVFHVSSQWDLYPAVGITANDIGRWAAGLNIGGGFDYNITSNWDISAGLKWQPMFDDWRKNPVVISIGAAYKF